MLILCNCLKCCFYWVCCCVDSFYLWFFSLSLKISIKKYEINLIYIFLYRFSDLHL